MNITRLVFYAVATFFLGSIAVAIGGPAAIESTFGITSSGGGFSAPTGEPLRTWMVAATIVAPIFFLLLAVIEAVRPSNRP